MNRHFPSPQPPEADDLPGPVPSDGAATARRLSAALARLAPLATDLAILAIVALSLVPGEMRPSIGLAKAAEHGLAYLAVAAVLTVFNRAGAAHVFALVVFAGALEIAQSWVPGRDPDPIDFLGSAAGAVIGHAIGRFALTRWRRPAAPSTAVIPARPGRLSSTLLDPVVALGALGVAASLACEPGAAGWLGASLAIAMLGIAVVDARSFIIPNWLSATALALGFLHAWVSAPGRPEIALLEAVLRAGLLAMTFWALRVGYYRLRGRQGIGLGDVKLAAVAGCWLGWTMIPIAIEIAALSALAIHALRHYGIRHRLRADSRLPFGLYLAPSIWIGWLLQATLLRGW
ncbi:prepilin peptidase [Rhodopseudomonas sp. NSM]|uniref:prepilin peptidase n=1 Tax=Rhodopseudomonas sp. NSM TaxID=3457630 RepID=UPI004035BC51